MKEGGEPVLDKDGFRNWIDLMFGDLKDVDFEAEVAGEKSSARITLF